ncbi:hypothetical protein HDV01_004627 [Terramyces sp. JEL0728]|nr:hypothetical protein HDV01_004627 [Terramyces sp. JEL0728]
MEIIDIDSDFEVTPAPLKDKMVPNNVVILDSDDDFAPQGLAINPTPEKRLFFWDSGDKGLDFETKYQYQEKSKEYQVSIDSEDSDFESSVNNSQPTFKSEQQLLQKEQELLQESEMPDISKMLEKERKKNEKANQLKIERLQRQMKKEQEKNIRLENKLKLKQIREEEKEEKRREKQKEKETQDLESVGKKAIQTANKLRQKIECAREVIAHLCKNWNQNDPFLNTSLKEVGVETRIETTAVKNSMTLTHKVDRIYDFENSIWNPCSLRLEKLPYILIMLSAMDIAEILKSDQSLMNYFTDCTSKYKGDTIIFLVVGLPEYYKAFSSAQTAIRNDEIREQLTSEKRKKRKANDILDGPDKKTIERELILLQIFGKGKCKIHTCNKVDIHGFIVSFIQQIALFPDM